MTDSGKAWTRPVEVEWDRTDSGGYLIRFPDGDVRLYTPAEFDVRYDREVVMWEWGWTFRGLTYAGGIGDDAEALIREKVGDDGGPLMRRRPAGPWQVVE